MNPNVSALERAFQLARSGRLVGIQDVRAQLKREGYDDRAVEGRSLIDCAKGHAGRPLTRFPLRPLPIAEGASASSSAPRVPRLSLREAEDHVAVALPWPTFVIQSRQHVMGDDELEPAAAVAL